MKIRRIPSMPSSDVYALISQKSLFYNLVGRLASCRRKSLTSSPAPELSCIIQVKSGYRDRSGFLGDLGGSVIFEIADNSSSGFSLGQECFPTLS